METTDSLGSLADAAAEQRGANIAKLKDLMTRGLLDQSFDLMIMAAKIELLIEFAVPAAVRDVFNHAWEQVAAQRIEDYEKMRVRDALTQGIEVVK